MTVHSIDGNIPQVPLCDLIILEFLIFIPQYDSQIIAPRVVVGRKDNCRL